MSIYVAEIAGKDSISAVHKFMCENQGNIIIPSIVFTGTEYGNRKSYYDSIEYLLQCSSKYNSIVKEAICLSDFTMWNCFNAKFQYLLNKKFGFFTPCIMCHFYTHILRIPLLKEKNAVGIITGERYSHRGIVKPNQHQLTIGCFEKIFSRYGIRFIRPLIGIEDTEIVDQEISNEKVLKHSNDVKCVLSNNLYGFDLNDKENLVMLENYLNEFVDPVGCRCVEEILENGNIDESILLKIIMEKLK